MNYFYLSNQCFNIASIVYAITVVLYVGHLVSNRVVFEKGSTGFARLGWFLHTTALGLRWVHSGVQQPPWTNLYESLVFFSWGVMGIHLFLEWKRGFKFTGLFASSVVFVAMGIASLHPNKEVEPLVPALQSWWLLFHVFMACIAYAFFLGSSFVAVFYLIKDKVKMETIGLCSTVFAILFLALAAGKSVFLGGEFQFFKITQVQSSTGEMKDVIMNFQGADKKPVQEFVIVPWAKNALFILIGLYLANSLFFFLSRRSNSRQSIKRLSWIILSATCLIHAGFLVGLVNFLSSRADAGVKSNPYKMSALILTLGVSLFALILVKFKDRLIARLPDLDVLDRWEYEAIFLGVPFMTLNLVSGAVWAYYAWGRYWGWDPKEVWAFITWLVYVIYLHQRILAGWKGKKTAVISVLGFFVVVFTYLGVNLVISGLHSYATG